MALAESVQRTRREPTGRRNEAIVAAGTVFSAKGFHDAQMTEIAGAAGLSLASMYSMFKGKDELYRLVLAGATERMRNTVQDAVVKIEDPADALLAVIDALFESFEGMHDLIRMVMSGNQGLPWRMREELGEGAREVTADFMGWVIALAHEARNTGYLEGIDPEVFARTMVGAVASAAASAAVNSPARPFTAAAPAIRAIFERVLGQPRHA